MAADIKKNDDFSKGPISKTVLRLAVPMVLAQFVNVLYNIVDRMYIGHISDTSVDALTGVGVTFPILLMVTAFANLFGSGGTPLFSMARGAAQQGGEEGEKQRERAADVMNNTFSMLVITGVILCIVVLLLKKPVLYLFGASDATYPYADSYLSIYMLGSVFMMVSLGMNGFINAQGFANRGMLTVVIGAVVNIALDPLFIFTFNMGISGAGVATAVSQYIGMAILLSVFLMKKPQSRISFKYFSFKPRIIWDIVSTGVPSFARQGLNSLSTMFLNIEAGIFGGDPCVAAMSIVAKCANVIFSVCVGIGQGFQPVSSFNYGAKKYNRVRQGIRFVWLFGTIVVAVLSAISFFLAPQIVSIFRDDAAVLEIGTPAFRYICVALVFLPTVMTANMTFQSLGKTGRAFFLACTQNGLFFIPLVIILPKFMGVLGIEAAQPIAYVISAFVAAPFLISIIKTMKE